MNELSSEHNFDNNLHVEPNQQDTIGGVFNNGLYGWIVVGAHIEIVSLKNGNRIAEYTFGDKRLFDLQCVNKPLQTNNFDFQFQQHFHCICNRSAC